MNNLEKYKIQLKEHIKTLEVEKAEYLFNFSEENANLSKKNIQIVKYLIECIEALEKSNDILDQCSLIGCQIADDRKFENERLFNKIKGVKL